MKEIKEKKRVKYMCKKDKFQKEHYFIIDGKGIKTKKDFNKLEDEIEKSIEKNL